VQPIAKRTSLRVAKLKKDIRLMKFDLPELRLKQVAARVNIAQRDADIVSDSPIPPIPLFVPVASVQAKQAAAARVKP
jgi:hypothetical protein